MDFELDCDPTCFHLEYGVDNKENGANMEKARTIE